MVKKVQKKSASPDTSKYTIEAVSPQVFELVPKNEEQANYIRTIKSTPVTIGIGPAGSGKTFVATVLAAQRLKRGDIDQLILIRPNEPLGPSLGMLKGDLLEKLAPWMAPYMTGLLSVFTRAEIQKFLNPEIAKIEMVAIEHLRGRSFNNADVLVDEVENMRYKAMKCLLTRIGENCNMVLCGDMAQTDIPEDDSGLQLLFDISETFAGKKPFKIVELDKCVRSDVAAFFLDAIAELEAEVDE